MQTITNRIVWTVGALTIGILSYSAMVPRASGGEEEEKWYGKWTGKYKQLNGEGTGTVTLKIANTGGLEKDAVMTLDPSPFPNAKGEARIQFKGIISDNRFNASNIGGDGWSMQVNLKLNQFGDADGEVRCMVPGITNVVSVDLEKR